MSELANDHNEQKSNTPQDNEEITSAGNYLNLISF